MPTSTLIPNFDDLSHWTRNTRPELFLQTEEADKLDTLWRRMHATGGLYRYTSSSLDDYLINWNVTDVKPYTTRTVSFKQPWFCEAPEPNPCTEDELFEFLKD